MTSPSPKKISPIAAPSFASTPFWAPHPKNDFYLNFWQACTPQHQSQALLNALPAPMRPSVFWPQILRRPPCQIEFDHRAMQISLNSTGFEVNCFRKHLFHNAQALGTPLHGKQTLKLFRSAKNVHYLMTNTITHSIFSKIRFAVDLTTKNVFIVKELRLSTLETLHPKKTIVRSRSALINECNLLRLVNSVYQFFDFGIYENKAYLITRAMRGNTVDVFSNNHDFLGNKNLVLMIGQQIAKQISKYHQQGIVHCDLKLNNFLLDHQGTFHVDNFGQAMLLTRPSKTFLNQDNCHHFISFGYRAPEYFESLVLTQKVDVWSLGIALLALWQPHIELFPQLLLSEHDTIKSYHQWFHQRFEIENKKIGALPPEDQEPQKWRHYNHFFTSISHLDDESQRVANFILCKMLHPNPQERVDMNSCYRFFLKIRPADAQVRKLRFKLITQAINPLFYIYHQSLIETLAELEQINKRIG